MSREELRSSLFILTGILLVYIFLVLPWRKSAVESWNPRFSHADTDEVLSASYFDNPRDRLNATERLLNAGSCSPILHANKARALYELERFKEARREMLEYLNHKPDDRQALIWLEQIEKEIK